MTDILTDIDELAARVPSGAMVAIAKEPLSPVALALGTLFGGGATWLMWTSAGSTAGLVVAVCVGIGLLIAVFAGWVLSRETVADELGFHSQRMFRLWHSLVLSFESPEIVPSTTEQWRSCRS